MATATKKTRILSIDGGGIRGIIPGTILTYLENKICERTKNPLARLVDYFDLVAGTSTGGILTCILLCPSDQDPKRSKYSAQQAVNLYLDKGDEIFATTLWQKIKSAGGIIDEKYSAAELEKYLKEYLGNVKMSQLIRPCLITSYDIKNRKTVFFDKKDAVNDFTDYYARDVARATSAAPTYFEVANTHSISGVPYPMIDGGVFANNPAMCALVETTKLTPMPKLSDTMMLSIGTGVTQTQKSYSYDDAKKWGLAKWAKPLFEILMATNSETTDYQLKRIFQASGGDYFRLETTLVNADLSMDNATQQNMKALKDDAGQFIANNQKLLNDIVDKILA